jgi:hypothetical protein
LKKVTAADAKTKGTPSPRSRANQLLRHWRSSEEKKRVARTLTFQFSVLADFKAKYKNTREEKVRNSAARFVCGKLVRKYKLQKLSEDMLSISSRRWEWGLDGGAKQHQRKARVNHVHARIIEYYCRDDVSRVTTGKANTITRAKLKKQRRLISDTLTNLHLKFTADTGLSTSYSLFCKLRPFYVVEPTELDSKTCQCKVHENTQFMADALKKQGLISSNNLDDLVTKIVCNPESKECAYDKCDRCKGKKGKGAPDGIGGVLKRTADRLVRLGNDIPDAEALYEKLSGSGTSENLFFIESTKVEEKTREILALGTLPTLKGTMKLNQIVCLTPGKFMYRDVSCMCKANEGVLDCKCFEPKHFQFETIVTPLLQAKATAAAGASHDDRPNVHEKQAAPAAVSDGVASQTLLLKPDKIIPDHEGAYCVIVYDEKLYPGIIIEDEVKECGDIEVSCMKPLGRNRFHWPQPKDISLYCTDDVLSLIPEPELHDGRRPYYSVNEGVWKDIEKEFERI